MTAITDELELFDDWMDRYQFIIDMGRKLPPFPDDWANDAHRVPGCQSRVWMEAAPRDGKLFAGLSDAAIVSASLPFCCGSIPAARPRRIPATDPCSYMGRWRRCRPTVATGSRRWRARCGTSLLRSRWSVMTGGGMAGGLNHASKQRA